MKKTLCFSQYGNFWANTIEIEKADAVDPRGSQYSKFPYRHSMKKIFKLLKTFFKHVKKIILLPFRPVMS